MNCNNWSILRLNADFFLESKYKITNLPASLVNLHNLKALSLNDQIVSTLPDHFGKLNSLEKLSLRGLGLNALPASIGSLIHLKELNLKSK